METERFTMHTETLSLQIFKELLLLLEVPRKILRLLTTNLNQLVINLEVRVSCNNCFLFMGLVSSHQMSLIIMYHDERGDMHCWSWLRQQLFCLVYVFSTAKPESFAQVKLWPLSSMYATSMVVLS